MDIKDIDPKLLKIIALARDGIGGEKEAAIALVRRICERDGLDFDEVMDGKDQPKEHTHEFTIRSADELQIAIQVAARFATTPEHPKVSGGGYRSRDFQKLKWVKYTCTTARHIDTVNAIDVYLKAYRREKRNIARALQVAFYSHHGLFSQFTEDRDGEPEPKQTLQQRQDAYRAAMLSSALTESANLRKTIEGGNGA